MTDAKGAYESDGAQEFRERMGRRSCVCGHISHHHEQTLSVVYPNGCRWGDCGCPRFIEPKNAPTPAVTDSAHESVPPPPHQPDLRLITYIEGQHRPRHRRLSWFGRLRSAWRVRST